jgi:hypothetical protein
MIRLLVVPRDNEFVIRIPDDMIGKPVEILAFRIPAEAEVAADEAEEVPNRDTFLSYLQSSGFASRATLKQGDEDPKRR